MLCRGREETEIFKTGEIAYMVPKWYDVLHKTEKVL